MLVDIPQSPSKTESVRSLYVCPSCGRLAKFCQHTSSDIENRAQIADLVQMEIAEWRFMESPETVNRQGTLHQSVEQDLLLPEYDSLLKEQNDLINLHDSASEFVSEPAHFEFHKGLFTMPDSFPAMPDSPPFVDMEGQSQIEKYCSLRSLQHYKRNIDSNNGEGSDIEEHAAFSDRASQELANWKFIQNIEIAVKGDCLFQTASLQSPISADPSSSTNGRMDENIAAFPDRASRELIEWNFMDNKEVAGNIDCSLQPSPLESELCVNSSRSSRAISDKNSVSSTEILINSQTNAKSISSITSGSCTSKYDKFSGKTSLLSSAKKVMRKIFRGIKRSHTPKISAKPTERPSPQSLKHPVMLGEAEAESLDAKQSDEETEYLIKL